MICYVATHTDTGKRYVGISTRSLRTRKTAHESHAHAVADHSFFHQAIRAYGPGAFSWKVVATGDKDVIQVLENALIATYRTNDPDQGFNSRGGRESGNVAALDMLAGLDRTVRWVERNQPDADRYGDLRELCRRLLERLDRIDPEPRP